VTRVLDAVLESGGADSIEAGDEGMGRKIEAERQRGLRICKQTPRETKQTVIRSCVEAEMVWERWER